MDQATLAERVGLSRSSMSRILSGAQEPKLGLAYELARALGVTLDSLVDDEVEVDAASQMVLVREDELAILKMVRRLGVDAAIDRLLGLGPAAGPGSGNHRDAPPGPGRGPAGGAVSS